MNATQLVEGTALLAWRRRQLQRGGRSVDLDWLLDLAGGLSWSDLQKLLVDSDRCVALHCTLQRLEALWTRHLQCNEPLQHLVGQCPWRDLLLDVSAAALIPRQETELLPDLMHTLSLRSPLRRWADLGTGSGAIALSMARAFPEAKGHAVDLSGEALQLTARNMARLQLSNAFQLHLGSWWEPLRSCWGEFDLVISNPPYIPEALLLQLDPVVRDHEPPVALDGGADGLDCIRSILCDAGKALAAGGWLLLEHHHDQSETVLRLMREAGLVDVASADDLQGITRFAMARRSGEEVMS